MKIAFISDIHGNAVALESVLADIRQKSIDRIMVLGDLCYRGPEPQRSLELIRSLHEAKVIKGNVDEWTVRGLYPGEVPDHKLDIMNREREWTASRLAPADLDYLKHLPVEIRERFGPIAIHAFHAAPNSLFDNVPSQSADDVLEAKLMSAADAQVYIYAHIHKPFIRYINGKIIMNSGSVGLPFDGLPMASYATATLHDGWISTSIERVKYDVEQVAEQYIQGEYPHCEFILKALRSARVD